MNEKEIKTLLRLLDKFRALKGNIPGRQRRVPARCDEFNLLYDEFNGRERSILATVRQWVAWYGRDELNMDL